MKKIAIAFLTALVAFSGIKVSAQGKFGPDSADCIKYLSYYKEYYKQKNYKDALPNWRKAYKLCPPTASQNMLIHGTTMLRNLIRKNANNPEYQQKLVDSLIALHDVRAQYYPKKAVMAMNNKGLDLANYVRNNPKRLYDEYNTIIEHNKAYTNPPIFIFDLNAAIELYNNGDIQVEDVIKSYQRAIEYIENSKKIKNADEKSKIKSDIENLFISSKVASCDNLIALFTPRFEANPNDVELVTNIVKMMSLTEGCMDNDLYVNAATALYNLEPSANSAYFLYRLYAGRDDVENAMKYLEESVNFEDEDPAVTAVRRFELAKYCVENGNTAKAYSNAQKAMELDSSLKGKCYYLMGTIWGSVKCSGNEIEQRAPYWVAVDFMVKAKKADPEMAEDANRLIREYSKYFPQASDAFMYDITDGQSYTVSCGGMRATTIVRTQK